MPKYLDRRSIIYYNIYNKGKVTLCTLCIFTNDGQKPKSSRSKRNFRHFWNERAVTGLSIASDLIRGHTDTIVLSLLSLGDSYGYKINKDIMELTAGRFEFKEATLYTAFRRL